MSNQGRVIILVVLFIAILAGIFFFGRFLRLSDLNAEQPPVRTLVRLTQTTETTGDSTETTPAATQEDTVQPTPTTQPAASGNFPCDYSWAQHELPEATTALQTAFNEAGIKTIGVLYVKAYGEDCMDSTGATSFGAMSSDFYLSAIVSNLDDASAMAQTVKTAYITILAAHLKLPAEPGYLDIVISMNGLSKNFRSLFSTLRPLIEAKKGDSELLAAGGL